MDNNDKLNAAKRLANIIMNNTGESGFLTIEGKRLSFEEFGTVPAENRAEVYVMFKTILLQHGMDFDNELAA